MAGTTDLARRAMPPLTTAEAVLDSLLRQGIDTLYALPGVHNDQLFDAAQRASDR